MAFPQIEDAPHITNGLHATALNSNSITVPMPSVVQSGELLMIQVSEAPHATPTTPSGWTEKASIAYAGGKHYIYAKVAGGGEAGTNVTVSFSVTCDSISAGSFRISGWGGDLSSIEYSVLDNGYSGTAPVPSLTPTFSGDVLFLAIASGQRDTNSLSFTTAPTNYTNFTNLLAEATSGNYDAVFGYATRELNIGDATTENPDEFQISENANNGTFLLAIEPAVTNPLSGNITLNSNPEEGVEVGIWEISTLSFNLSDLGTPEEVVSTDANGDWEGAHDPTKTYFIAVLHNKLRESGTASGGSLTSLDDSSKAMTVDEHAGRMIEITGGTGSGQMRKIASNTSTSFTPDVDFDLAPDNTSTYEVYDMYGAKTKIIPATG